MAVECAYTPLLAKMDTTDIDVEAVFTASSHLLDDLLTVSIVSQDQVDQYWSNMLVGARRMSKEVSLHDAAVVVYTVFCVGTPTTKILCASCCNLRWNERRPR